MNAPLRELPSDGNRAIDWHPGELWSLWDMLKLNAASFYKATAMLYNIRSFVNHWKENREHEDAIKIENKIDISTAKIVLENLRELQSSLLILGTTITSLAVDRLLKLLTPSVVISYQEFHDRFREIDNRLKDELSLVSTFVLEPEKVKFYEPAEPLFGLEFETKFPSGGVYEIDEAAKCMALGRDTAAVFHLMRCMEIGIRTVAKSLGIPDPTKGSDRNWHEMLRKIKLAMDAKLNPPTWKLGDREIFESAYGSLDAVRVAWRNTTMHVENKYTHEEAEHIFIATRGFMKKLASRMDEQGIPLA